MNKVIFESIGNTIMFILLGLFLTLGLTIHSTAQGFGISLNIYAFVFLAYMVVYGIVLILWNKKQGGPLLNVVTSPQLHLDIDEREGMISLKAARSAYLATILTVAFASGAFFLIHFVDAANMLSIDLFVAGSWLFVIICVTINLTYSISWCREYRR